MKLLVHIVTWNDKNTILGAIESVVAQSGFTLGENLFLRITDNASTDGTAQLIEQNLQLGITLVKNESNLGFCGAHNQVVPQLLDGSYDVLLVLNPDVCLEGECISALNKGLDLVNRVGMTTPKLLRAGSNLRPLTPPTIDAAGMELFPSLRHLDRGSGEVDIGQYDKEELVFGGTGACLLIAAQCVRALLIPDSVDDSEVFRIYPQLRADRSSRIQLFDEAFFAYREDADLAWRARNVGWRCRYTPTAVAYHVRAVTPENRAELPSEINLYSVRNRFLLQLNNWSLSDGIRSLFEGIMLRNALVVGGVLLRERSSLTALLQALKLAGRALSIRGVMRTRSRSERSR